MLVLTRKTDQSIMVGDIEVTVIEIRGDHIRLGINAPRDVAVHRKEVYLEIQQENRAAAGSGVYVRDTVVTGSTVGLTVNEIRRLKK